MSESPLFTAVYENFDDFQPEQGSVFIYARSSEDRSQGNVPNILDGSFLNIVSQSHNEIVIAQPPTTIRIPLRNSDRLRELWNRYEDKIIYIDVTGMDHRTWAPLLLSSIRNGNRVRVVYREPEDYSFAKAPKPGEVFDLSESIEGIEALPGFSSLTDITSGSSCFIPLLGFEGSRLSYILEQVQPSADDMFPIIGVPGFRPEYPFYTYQGNQLPLQRQSAWRQVRYAKANDPFSLFYELCTIYSERKPQRMVIAPIGTKPHAIGAILFSILNPGLVEIVYDHPIRRGDRTKGAANTLVYQVSSVTSTFLRT